MILNMLRVTVILAKGSAEPVEELLKDILGGVEGLCDGLGRCVGCPELSIFVC